MAGFIGISDELYESHIVMGLSYQSTCSTQVWNLWYYISWCTRRYSALMSNPRCQSTSMMRGIGCGDMWPRERFRMQRVVSFNFFERLICECISRSRTMEVALVICCAYEWDWNYMRWMAVDVDLDHKNDDSHVIGCWSVVVWRAMMYTGGDRDWTAPWGELESFFLGIVWRGLTNQNGCCYVSTNEILRSDYWSIAVDDDVTARYG